MLGDAGKGHQLGQIPGCGHDENLVLGHEGIIAARNDGGNSPRKGNHPKWEFMIGLGDFFQFLGGYQRVEGHPFQSLIFYRLVGVVIVLITLLLCL